MKRAGRLLLGILVAAGIGVTSFAIRSPALDRAFTIDEKLWIERSDRFADAVFSARFGDAIETGHPGVTTMWVGGLAQHTLPADATLRERYARARVSMAFTASLLIVLIWWLTRIVAGEAAALLAGLLLAFDPFLMTHNRVLHMDGLLSLFMLSSFLALLGYLRTDRGRLLVLSGILGGLALLTKQPAAFLVGAVAVVLWRDRRGIAKRFLHWLIPAAVTAFALWPVLWVRPWHAVALMAGGGGAALIETNSGGFFLGKQVEHPGPLFYPVVIALRSSVVTLPAGIATAVWAIRRRKADPAARTAASLLAFALGFMIVISLAPKKGDRYLLPAFVAADVAIALAAARAIVAWLSPSHGTARRVRLAVVCAVTAGLLAVHGLPAIDMSPYQNAAFNPLLGGAATARHAIVVGWGEGLDEAAEALNRLPGAAGLTVATTRITQFEDFFAGRTISVDDSTLVRPDGTPADLVLFYISSVQVGRVPQVWARFKDQKPIWRLDIEGIPYVRVYRVAAGS